MATRSRIYSRFGRTPRTTFFVDVEPEPKSDAAQSRRVSHGLAHKLKNPKFKRVVQTLTVISTYHLWPAFQSLRADGMPAEEAAAEVVREFRRGCT